MALLAHTSVIRRRSGSFAGTKTVRISCGSPVRLRDDGFEHREVDLVEILDVQEQLLRVVSPLLRSDSSTWFRTDPLVINASRRYNISNST
jgi:hypothetical protein